MARDVSIEFSPELKRFFRQAPGQFKQAAARALYQEAELVMGKSKEMCPVDTGTLRDSGYVKPPETTADKVSVEMGYGGAAQEYAIYVHENLNANHPVGEAKFLEKPVNEVKPQLANNLARRIRNDLGL